MDADEAALQALQRRQERILDDIGRFAASVGCEEASPELLGLEVRQALLLERIGTTWDTIGVPSDDSAWDKQGRIFEERLAAEQGDSEGPLSQKGVVVAEGPQTTPKRSEEQPCCLDASELNTRVLADTVEHLAAVTISPHDAGKPDGPGVEDRLSKILESGGVTNFRFVRVPEDYYSRSFQERRDLLGAASIFHLCKSIVMINTQGHIRDCSDPKNSKFYLIVVQYCARLNAEKVRQFVYSLNSGAIPKKRFNFRLASEQDSLLLTGFGHNAVTPIGMHSRIPVILSDAILKLKPDFFWLGGGEVDLKLGIKTDEFVSLLQPFVADCT